MIPGSTTKPWATFEAKAELNNSLDGESFIDDLKKIVDPHPHLAFITGAYGVEEHTFFDDYYFRVVYKSDLPAEQASDEMKNALWRAEPNVISSWLSLQISEATTAVDVAEGIAQDTAEVAQQVASGAKTVAGIAQNLGEATPSLVGNLHLIVIGGAVLAVVAAGFYFGPIILARFR